MDSKIGNRKPIQSERDYIDKIPFVNELIKRIDDINQSIRRGDTGEDEAINLITDLPDSWKSDIQDELDRIERTYNLNKIAINKRYSQGTPRSYKQQLDSQRIEAGKDYSRNVKRIVINLLDSKGMLFITKDLIPESAFLDMHDKDESEDPE